jgi:hypothetical protein
MHLVHCASWLLAARREFSGIIGANSSENRETFDPFWHLMV